MRKYQFVVGLGPYKGNTIVVVQAANAWDAKRLAEMQYGKGNVMYYGEAK